MRRLLPQLGLYTAALLTAIVILAPPIWLFISSISSSAELLSVPVHWIPETPTFDRYMQVITATGGESAANFRRSLLNSLAVALLVTSLCITVGALAAYSFARMSFFDCDHKSHLAITEKAA